MPQTLKSYLLGASLACLFFFPLVFTVYHDSYLMQWSTAHSLELAFSWIIVSLILGTLINANERLKGSLASHLFWFLIVFFPLASFGFKASVVLGLEAGLISLITFLENNRFLLIVFFSAILLSVGTIMVFYRTRFKQLSERIIFSLSPLIIISIIMIAEVSIRSHINGFNVFFTERPHSTSSSFSKQGSIFIFLFDGMDYNFLYSDDKTVSDKFPNMKDFSQVAVNYHRAISPGTTTRNAMTGLLAGRRFNPIKIIGDAIYETDKNGDTIPVAIDKDNIFSHAQDQGFETIMYGNYLPYCQMIGPHLNHCRSFSRYNYSSVWYHFSILDPILATIHLWPHRTPVDFLSGPISLRFHRQLLEQTYQLAILHMESTQPLFQFAHFGIPHPPFIYDNSFTPWNNRQQPNPANYDKQLQYADRFFGRLLDSLRDANKFENSTIVILSDHAYRGTSTPDTVTHVPMMIKLPSSTKRRDNFKEVQTEEILKLLSKRKAIL